MTGTVQHNEALTVGSWKYHWWRSCLEPTTRTAPGASFRDTQKWEMPRMFVDYILDNDADMISKLDFKSVLSLELTCPSLSDGDAQALKGTHIGQSLTEKQRGMLMTQTLDIDTLIPSFRSLFDE